MLIKKTQICSLEILFHHCRIGKQRQRGPLALVRRNQQDLTVSYKDCSRNVSGYGFKKTNGPFFESEMHVLKIKLGISDFIDSRAVQSDTAELAIKCDGILSPRWR